MGLTDEIEKKFTAQWASDLAVAADAHFAPVFSKEGGECPIILADELIGFIKKTGKQHFDRPIHCPSLLSIFRERSNYLLLPHEYGTHVNFNHVYDEWLS